MLNSPDLYLFLIDTNIDLKTLHSNLCGYVTGQRAQSGNGRNEAKIAREDAPELTRTLDPMVLHIQNENDYKYPSMSFDNPNYESNNAQSCAIYFNQVPSPEIIAAMQERAKLAASEGIGGIIKQQFRIEGFRFFEQYTIYRRIY